MTENQAHGYSSESTQPELSNEYTNMTGFRRFLKIFASLCLCLEGLNRDDDFKRNSWPTSAHSSQKQHDNVGEISQAKAWLGIYFKKKCLVEHYQHLSIILTLGDVGGGGGGVVKW